LNPDDFCLLSLIGVQLSGFFLESCKTEETINSFSNCQVSNRYTAIHAGARKSFFNRGGRGSKSKINFYHVT